MLCLAEDLDCAEELQGIREIMRAGGASYQRQRAVAAQNGGELDAVVAALVEEMRAGHPVLDRT